MQKKKKTENNNEIKLKLQKNKTTIETNKTTPKKGK